jgi:hypothetical protein
MLHFMRLSAAVWLVLLFPSRRADAFLITGSYTTGATADAFLTTGPSGNLSADNFGGEGSLAVAAGGLPGGQFQTLLRFDLSGARAALDAQAGVGQWNIFDVVLALSATPPGNGIFNPTAAGLINVSLMQNNTWVEGTGTAAAPATSGVSFNGLPGITSPADQALGVFHVGSATSGDSLFTLALTPGLVNGILSGGDIDLRLSAADNAVAYLFKSRSDANLYPLLRIDVVPEPGGAFLGALGVAVFWLWGNVRRRRG